MSLKVKSTIAIGFTLVMLLLLLPNLNAIGSTNSATYFDDFSLSDLSAKIPNCTGCHESVPISVPGSGSINVTLPTTVEAGIEFLVNVSVSGFTEAAIEEIAVGFSSTDGNNSILGDFSDRVNDSITLDGFGDFDVLFDFTIPSEGNYNLTALAIWADESDNNKFYYVYGNNSITVTPSADNEAPAINSVLLDSVEATNNSADLSTDVLIQVNATDTTAVKKVSLIVDTDDPEEMLFNNVSNLYEYTLNTYFITNGPFILQIYVEDSLGNNASKAYSLDVLNSGVEGDVTAYKITPLSNIIIGNAIVDEYWDNFQEFIVEEFSSEDTNGWVKAAHDDYYLYMLVAYANEKITWLAFELDATEENMVDGNDGWAFGEGDGVYQGDIYYIGLDHPAIDSRNDISYEIMVTEGEPLNYIEFKRPLITNDESGKDIDLIEGNIYNIKFASNGLPIYHKSGDERPVYTFAISPSFPSGNGNPTTITTTTNSRSPQQIKDENYFNFFVLAGLGLGLNVSIIVIIYIFQRRKVL